MVKKLLCTLGLSLLLSAPSFADMPKPSDQSQQVQALHGRYYRLSYRRHRRHHRRYRRVMYYYNRGEEHHGVSLPLPSIHRAGDNDED